jgi:hypothetical protein
MLPWTHLHVWPTGAVYPCCTAPLDKPMANLKDSSLKEVWNCLGLKKIRKNMLADRKSPECKRCYELEKVGMESQRLKSNAAFQNNWKTVRTTKKDGRVPKLNLKYMDIRFSNVCNFRCRTCGPQLSSGWYKDASHLSNDPMVDATAMNPLSGLREAKNSKAIWSQIERLYEKFGPPEIWKNLEDNYDRFGDQAILRPTPEPKDLWSQIEPLIPRLEEIYFAGGEPLLMEEHYKTLEILIKNRLWKMRLGYNTNFSNLIFKEHDVIKMWQNFEHVYVGASLDAMEARGEYMRKGQNWEQIVLNRKRLMKEAPHVHFTVAATLSVMNSLHLPDFHKRWVEEGLIPIDGININLLTFPAYFRLQVLPQSLKEKVVEKYRRHITDFIKPFGEKGLEPAKHFQSAVDFILSQDLSSELKTFRDQTKKLDLLRGEDFAKTFPELKTLVQKSLAANSQALTAHP